MDWERVPGLSCRQEEPRQSPGAHPGLVSWVYRAECWGGKSCSETQALEVCKGLSWACSWVLTSACV